jgi:hypothetical protein
MNPTEAGVPAVIEGTVDRLFDRWRLRGRSALGPLDAHQAAARMQPHAEPVAGRAIVDDADGPPALSSGPWCDSNAVHLLDQCAGRVVGEARVVTMQATTVLDGSVEGSSGEGLGAGGVRCGGHGKTSNNAKGVLGAVVPTGWRCGAPGQR